MKKLLFFLLTGFTVAQAEIYLEPRVSYLVMGGTPDIGDVGFESGSSGSKAAAGLAVGCRLTPRLGLELRYTRLGSLTITKTSPHWNIFPPDDQVTLPAVRLYDFEQRTELFTAALRFQAWSHDRLSLDLFPLLQIEDTEVILRDQGISPPLPNVLLVPPGWVIARRTKTAVQPGAEVSLGYQLNGQARARLNYTYSPLSTADAHLFGAGLEVTF